MLQAHPSNAMCLQFSPSGDYFAIGSADALVSVWDANDFVCLRTLSRFSFPFISISSIIKLIYELSFKILQTVIAFLTILRACGK